MATMADIHTHYDLNESEFFSLILGKTMSYTCADWMGVNNLEQAQFQKIDKISRLANITNETRSIVDLGCGWGKTLEYITRKHPKIKTAYGVTISKEQKTYCDNLFNKKRPSVIFQDLIDFLNEQPPLSIDAATMIGVIEHIASPKDFKKRTHIDAYRNVFKAINRAVTGNLGLQSIVAMKQANALKGSERDRAIRFQFFISKYIFPNALTPRDEYLREAMDGIYEVEQFEVRSDEYERTIICWKDNLDQAKKIVCPEKYALFSKYFDLCIEHFNKGYIGLARYGLKPIR